MLLRGDCLDLLPSLDENSIDSCVTDPPYGLSFMGREWDHGIPGKRFWSAIYRVLKPGAHLVAFGGTRTSHRMVCAIEDAGFEIRDSLMWVYGTGFPKSHNLHDDWEGWGTALKPAFEPIVLARKPLSEGTVAANVLRWGTGALNIDGCRVPGEAPTTFPKRRTPKGDYVYEAGFHKGAEETAVASPLGRWPANFVHDGSDEVLAAFPDSKARGGLPKGQVPRNGVAYGSYSGDAKKTVHNDSGSAARFFYSAKASKFDRNGSKHPTVKPIALMEWLCRLVTPKGGTVLDPFAGTGTTGEAAFREGFESVLIEREPEYQIEIGRRLDRLQPALAICPTGPTRASRLLWW